MKNDSFATPEILDVTEVEKTKIHETAETQRATVAEREATKRQKLSDRRTKWTNDGYLTVVGIVGVVFILSTLFGSMFYACYKYPTPQAKKNVACVESVQIVRVNDVPRVCSEGATMETKPSGNGGDLEILCTCSKK